jgi:hydrophobe/amphiphile efflux-1 (HAE1) family protein
MNFATWSIRNPIPSVVLFFLLTIAGVVSFHALTLKNMPDFDMGQFTVALSLPGASPTQLENEVARPAEDALAVLRDVKFISTKSSEGVVLIRVEFQLERNPEEALLDVKNAIDRIRGVLPRDLEEPRIRQHTLAGGAPTVTYAVTSDTLDEEALSWFVEDTVSRAVLALPGVNRFDVLGGVTREVQVEVDPVRLNALGITAADVSRALRLVQEEASGGRGHLGGSEQGVRTVATVHEVSELAGLPLVLPSGRHVRLDEVATVRDALEDRTTSARLDGRPAVGFQILHNPGMDEIALFDSVKRTVDALQAGHPGIKFKLLNTMAAEIQNEFDNSMHMLCEGALLAILVIWLFLRNWRSTLVGAIALPLSILPTFAFMYAAGFTINTVTMLALSVVVGILVDDAIVEVENISRRLKGGLSVREATESAVTEIGLAVVATTLALVIVFLPMSFMKGFSGLVFRQFGWTAVASILASLLVARLITPLASVWLLKPGTYSHEQGLATAKYLRLVRWCLRHGIVVLVVAAILLGGGFLLWSRLPTGYIPAADRSYTTVSVELPPGSTIDQTLAVAEEARQAIDGGPTPVPGVLHVFTVAGQLEVYRNGVTGGSAEVRTAELMVILDTWGHRPSETECERLIHERLANIPGAKFSVNGLGYGSRLNLILSGRNPATLLSAATALAQELATVHGLAGVMTSAGLDRTDIVIRPDRIRAAELGVTTEAISETVRIATSGDFAPLLAKLYLDTRQVYIRVRLPASAQEDLATISELRVPGREGLVPLAAVADVGIENGPLQIERYNRMRHIMVSADLAGMPLGTALSQVEKLPTMVSLPDDVTWVRGDEVELMDELFVSVGWVLVLAAICVYCLLVVLFKDFFQPITILSAVPLSAIGALLGVWLSGSEIGEPVLLGFVILLGIVTKNSILLVDYAIVAMRKQGLSEFEALVEACQKRARPIIMTTVAMVAGMLPLLLGFGQGDMTFSRPMAATVIGGLITSTGLSLIVVPVVFGYVAKLDRWMSRRIVRS